MPAFKIDFSSVGDQVLPAGEYMVTLHSIELRESKSSSNPYFNFRWDVVAPEEYTGRVVFSRASTSPQSLWVLKGLLTKLGYDRSLKELEFVVDETTKLLLKPDFVGVLAKVFVSTRKYKDTTTGEELDQNDIERILWSDRMQISPEVDPMGEDEPNGNETGEEMDPARAEAAASAAEHLKRGKQKRI